MRQVALVVCFLFFQRGLAQQPVDSVSLDRIRSTVHFLSAENLRGRENFTGELHLAAAFISDRFERAGLQAFPGFHRYYQPIQLDGSEGAIKDTSGRYLPKKVLLNVVGVLNGRSKPDEVILFSAHYDHVGADGSKIRNGANDNASGTAALVALAEYFAKRNDNERTILFCAFAGEELGLVGSTALVPYLIPEKVIAVINIEMIGKSSVGKNAFFVTGAHHSDVATILGRNLKGKVKVRREPASTRQLFERSDNFPFALKGIPAHSIMSSDDTDPCYHQPCDDASSLDFDNMAQIVRAIATGTQSLIDGKDTPKRIRVSGIQ